VHNPRKPLASPFMLKAGFWTFWWLKRMCAFITWVESFQTFINFHLTRTVITILNCHSSVNFTYFFTPVTTRNWITSLVFFGLFYQWKSYVKCIRMLSLLNQVAANVGRLILFISGIFFSVASHFWGKPKLPQLFFTFCHSVKSE